MNVLEKIQIMMWRALLLSPVLFLGGWIHGYAASQQNWVYAPDIGVDCTGATDSSGAIQSAVNANKSLHLMFPYGCNTKINSTIVISDGTGTSFVSANFAGDGTGAAGQAVMTWGGTTGFMFDFQHSDHPVIENLSFVSPGGVNCPDGFLRFDGNPASQIGTSGRVVGSSFNNGQCTNANFVGISISDTATGNHENYVLDTNTMYCGNGSAQLRARNGVTNGTTTLTSSTAAFVAGDVGKRIRISYAGGELDTTIATRVSATQVTLAVAPAWSQSNVTIITGTSYGKGYRNGASQNAIQQQFLKLQYVNCAVGIEIQGGNAQIVHPSGGYSDIGILVGGFVAQNMSIDYYASENDVRAIQLGNGRVAPMTISNSRFSNGNQMANGFVQLAGPVIFVSNLFAFDTPTNCVYLGNSSAGEGTPVTSINNYYKTMTAAQVGFNGFTYPAITSMNDILAVSSPQTLLTSNGRNAVQAYGGFADTDGIAHQGYATVLSGFGTNTHTLIGVQGTGSAGSNAFTNFIGVQGVGPIGPIGGAAVALEGAWDSTGINTGGGSPTGYTIRARSPASITGTVPNLYGVYIEKQKISGVTAGWGIYQVDPADRNYFGGPVLMQRNTATASAPGAGAAKLEVVCGTNSGTAKIIAYAGTSSTAVTVLDNIGSGVSGC